MTRGRPPGDPGAPPGTPRLAALRLLARRDYSAAELTTRLVDRGYDPTDVRDALDALAADGTLDDHRAARAHTRTAATIKRRGSHRIRRELEARGFDADAIRAALADLSPDDDLATIRRWLARRPGSGAATGAERQRLFRQLLRRGFPSDLIARALGSAPDDE